jgi:hypothetical protein
MSFTQVAAMLVAWAVSGADGALAAFLSGGVCLFGGVASLLAGSVFRGANGLLLQLGFGIGLRMGLPLLFALLVVTQGGPLVEAGIVYYLLAFYLIALLAETWLAVAGVAPSAKA